MIEDQDAGEQAARIVEALMAGADEADIEASATIAGELRANAGGWDDAERMLEERRANATAPLAGILDQALGAVRDRAVDD